MKRQTQEKGRSGKGRLRKRQTQEKSDSGVRKETRKADRCAPPLPAVITEDASRHASCALRRSVCVCISAYLPGLRAVVCVSPGSPSHFHSRESPLSVTHVSSFRQSLRLGHWILRLRSLCRRRGRRGRHRGRRGRHRHPFFALIMPLGRSRHRHRDDGSRGRKHELESHPRLQARRHGDEARRQRLFLTQIQKMSNKKGAVPPA